MFAVVDDVVVKEVYEVDCWLEDFQEEKRYKFEGKVASEEKRASIVDKLLPIIYREKGSANPIQYKKSDS